MWSPAAAECATRSTSTTCSTQWISRSDERRRRARHSSSPTTRSLPGECSMSRSAVRLDINGTRSPISRRGRRDGQSPNACLSSRRIRLRASFSNDFRRRCATESDACSAVSSQRRIRRTSREDLRSRRRSCKRASTGSRRRRRGAHVPLRDLGAAVGRAVVNDDELEVAVTLAESALERLGQELFAVADDRYGRDERWHLRRPLGPGK